MTDPARDRSPLIYTPLYVQVDRVLRGALSPGTMTIYAAAGIIGKDRTGGCRFTIKGGKLVLREGPESVQVGATYIGVLGDEMVTQASTVGLRQPIIDELFSVHGDFVTGYDGKPEPML